MTTKEQMHVEQDNAMNKFEWNIKYKGVIYYPLINITIEHDNFHKQLNINNELRNAPNRELYLK